VKSWMGAVTGCLSVIFLALCGIAILAFLAPRLLRESDPVSLGPRPSPEPEPSPPAPTAPPATSPPGTRPTFRPPVPSTPPTTVAPAPVPDTYEPWVDARRVFTRTEAGGSFLLHYGFIDHHGRPVDVSCRVALADHDRERAGFGYDEAAVQQELNAQLARRAAQELARRGLTRYVRLTFHGWGGYEWTSEIGGEAREVQRAVRERDEFAHWLKTTLGHEADGIQQALLQERGFLVEQGTVTIDYAGLATRGTRALADCANALSAAAGLSERRALGLFIAFLQELRYEVPPDHLEGRQIHGLWVPTEVLVNARGDCDSKAVAFCALWRTRAPRVLLVTLPDHALVAVEGKPGPGEHFVRLGNRYYVLCEVAGPGKSHPGRKPVSGTYAYVAIPGATD
jgi:hypothetical protein